MRQASAILVGDVTVMVGTKSVMVGTPLESVPMMGLSDETGFTAIKHDGDG